MTYGVARAATSPELELYRAPGKKSRFYCAIFEPHVIYTARINQVFTAWDNITSLIFDGGSGTLANIVADMIMYVGTSAGARDVGFVRVRGYDATHIIFDQYSGIKLQDNYYLTIVDEYRLLQRHISIIDNQTYMDGVYPYVDEHKKPDPTPIMGPHRIVKMEDSTVAITFDFSQSFVIDGTGITSKSTTCPTALSVTSGTTFTPTVTFDEFGWHAVYLDLLAANGKTWKGVRYVFVYDKDHLPPRVKIATPTGNVDAGGWQAEIEMYRHASVDDIYEGAFAIIFSEDIWGDTEEDIAIVPGSEKIEMVGWIGSPESIVQNPKRGSVKFTVHGPQYWMGRIASYPDGIRFKISDPVSWEFFKNLTIDKGVWHFLHWRTTLTRILDWFPCGDARLSPEVSSLAENLWAQLAEMTTLQILARPGFNALGQLFINVHPNLIPSGDRDFATVMTIEKSDWIGELDFDRVTLEEDCQVNASGIVLDAGGNGLAYFALAPGHTYDHFGTPDILDRLLVSSQESLTTLAGLYFSERNNRLPSIPINLKANVRLIDVFPNQKCEVDIQASDNVRGLAYAGGLIPVGVSVNFDDTTGRVTREVEFEAETFESLAVKEIVPGSGDVSTLPSFNFPDLPPFSGSLPGTGGVTPLDPKSVWVHDTTAGFLRCDNFNAAPNDQEWYPINGGLTMAQYQGANIFFKCPNGAFYAGKNISGSTSFLARAAYPGAPFVIVEDYTSMVAKFLGSTDNVGLRAANYNPLVAEQVFYVMTHAGDDMKVFVGAGASFPAGATLTLGANNAVFVSYGLGYWMLTASGYRVLFPSSGASVFDSDSVLALNENHHVRVGTSGITYNFELSGSLYRAENNMATVGASLYTPFRGVVAIDYTGALMISFVSGSTAIKSSDGAASFVNIGTLPVAQIWEGCYVGGGGSDSCWIMVSDGGYIYYSDDFFTGSPIDKRGNVAEITPFPHLNGVGVITRA